MTDDTPKRRKPLLVEIKPPAAAPHAPRPHLAARDEGSPPDSGRRQAGAGPQGQSGIPRAGGGSADRPDGGTAGGKAPHGRTGGGAGSGAGDPVGSGSSAGGAGHGVDGETGSRAGKAGGPAGRGDGGRGADLAGGGAGGGTGLGSEGRRGDRAGTGSGSGETGGGSGRRGGMAIGDTAFHWDREGVADARDQGSVGAPSGKPGKAGGSGGLRDDGRNRRPLRGPESGPSPADAPPVDDGLDGPLPQPRTMMMVSRVLGGRPSRVTRLFLNSGVALLTFLLGVAALRFFADLLDRYPLLGWLGIGLIGVFALASLAMAWREYRAWSRLAAIDRIGRDAGAALASGDLAEAREVSARLSRLYAGRPEMGVGRAHLARHGDEAFEARDLLAKHDETYMPREVIDTLKETGVYKEPTS